MKTTFLIFIGLITLILVLGFIIKKQITRDKLQSKSNKNIQTKIDKPVLKQYSDLKVQDFENYPIWVQCHIVDYEEKWYDDTDEETFRPWIGEIPVSPDYAMFLIKAELKLNDGEICLGFITPCLEINYQNENDLGFIQPQIFTKSGDRIGFWTGMFPMDQTKISDFYRKLNKPGNQIFPIQFNSIEGLANGITSGKINGFLTIPERNNIVITK
jgi:hypothetical protein